MTQNFSLNSANNVYIPTFSPEASGQLIVSYARDPKRFGLLKYTQVTKVEKQQGKYIRLNPYDQSRLLTLDGSDNVWADGADRPINSNVQFEYPAYSTNRHSYGFFVGDLSAQQAAWDIVAAKASVVASRMMSLQTACALTALTGSDMPTSTATVAGGGKWNAGNNTTATQNYFKIGVQKVLQTITLATNAVVSAEDICVIMNPVTASKLSQCIEVIDMVKQSPFAVEALRNDKNFSLWGLPSSLFGCGEVIVEPTVYTSTNPNQAGTGTQSFVLADGSIIFCARPGSIEGQMGSFSTCHGYFKEEMTVETWNDPVNRREVGSVTSDFQYVIAAPASGYLITEAV
jgi:hypothetical protein